jgi:hypothetical protein
VAFEKKPILNAFLLESSFAPAMYLMNFRLRQSFFLPGVKAELKN